MFVVFSRILGLSAFVAVTLARLCHAAEPTVRGEGAKIGPDLSNLVHRDYDSVLRDILEPSAALNPDYLNYAVATNDGRTFDGITPSKVSVMPQDVVKQLKPEQLRDLMTFLLLEPARAKKPQK